MEELEKKKRRSGSNQEIIFELQYITELTHRLTLTQTLILNIYAKPKPYQTTTVSQQ